MKKLNEILIAFCCIALFGQVAYSAEHRKIPKTEFFYSVGQLKTVVAEISAINETFAISASTEIEFNVSVLINGISENATAYVSTTLDHPNDGFSVSIGLLPDCTYWLYGSRMYLKLNKPLYRSPNVDDKWKWQFSQIYNC